MKHSGRYIAILFALSAFPASGQIEGQTGSHLSVSLAGEIDALSRAELGIANHPRPTHLDASTRAGPDIFGTATVPVGRALTDRRWQRISQSRAVHPSVAGMARSVAGLRRHEQAMRVNSLVNRTIAYRPDDENWGVADYWATADETLGRSVGDCEDIAVAKMQVLRRLGFDPNDLYLMVGRDSARGEHAVLLVRLSGRYWVLDDRMPAMVAADSIRTFTPVMTYGADTSWIHGIRRTPSARATAWTGTAPSAGSEARMALAPGGRE